MTLTLTEWKDILDAVKSDKGDILEQIKAELKERDKNTYQEWEKKAFDKNYKFCPAFEKFTLLHIAALNGHKEIVEYLIEKGAGVKAQNTDGVTALHCTAEHGHKEIVECLIKNGANINAKLYCKVREKFAEITPLHLAIKKNQAEVIKVLLDHILKLEAAGLYVSQGNLQKKGELIQAQYSYLLDCSKEHKEEVQRLGRKNKLLCDFLRESDTNKLINIWKKNEDIRSQFDNKESLKAQYPIYADILINKANEVKKEISLHNSARTSVFSFVATTISVGLFLGIAYFAGAATLTPVVPAITVFIVAAAVGALVGYGVGKFCEKVSEEKQKDPDMSTCAAVKSLLCDVFTTEYSKSQLNA